MSNKDIISFAEVISKLPQVLGNLPRLLKGSRMARFTDKNVPVGLAMGFQLAAQQNPQGMAIYYQDLQLSYMQLNAWANQIAHYLSSIGLRKGDTIALDMENRPEMLAVIIGCAKLGLCIALLNTSQRGKVLVHSFNLVKPKAAVIGAELTPAIDEVRDQLDLPSDRYFSFADQNTLDDSGIVPDGYLNLAELIGGFPSANPDTVNNIFLTDPLFYIYTSGTTGLPKAVVFNNGRWWRGYGAFGFSSVRLNASDRLYCTLPLYHATGLVVCWSSVIAAGACLVLSRKFSASRFWDDIRRYECTAFGYVGELCRYLHEQPAKPNDRDNKVRVIVGNGLRPNIWMPLKARFGIERVVEFYGSSEGNIAFTNVFNFDKTVGFSPVSYAIVEYDKERDEPVKRSDGFMIRAKKGKPGLMIGEITDSTPFDGYTDPEKTEKSIFRNVFKKGDAWFNTGDLMRDIGYRHAQFVDRLGDTFRWKGENVSTTEVEQIIDSHENVVESIVYGVEIPNTNGRAGMAQLRLDRPVDEFDFGNFVSHMKKELPHYAIPVFIRINLEQVETTTTFKHQKNILKEQKYRLSVQSNPVLVMLPDQAKYQMLTPEVEREIEDGKYRF